MITTDIIEVLREDSQIQSLLDASSSSDCAVFTSYNFDDTVTKQINISLEYGETVPFDQSANTYDGIIRVYVMVKDTINEPIKTTHQIADRVLTLLDLKGTTLSDTNTIYWVQKTDSDFTHYDNIRFYELLLSFRFVITNG